eukprot:c2427_g1_i1.p1 GENE.c2427_g1_i1~~c2427_g1_i1.p1  ORF type:complete len:425 (+),score=46.34 c2427_g1_i1:148-1422(+)
MHQARLPEPERQYLRKRERVHLLRKFYVILSLTNHLVAIVVLFFLISNLKSGDGFACCSSCSAKSFAAVSPSAVRRSSNGTCILMDGLTPPSRLISCGFADPQRETCFPRPLCNPDALDSAFTAALSKLANVVIAKLATVAVSFVSLVATSYKPLKHNKRKLILRLVVYACALIGLILAILIFVLGVGKGFISASCEDMYPSSRKGQCRAARSLCGLQGVLVITNRGALTVPAVVTLTTAIVSGALLLFRYLLCRRRMSPTYTSTTATVTEEDFAGVGLDGPKQQRPHTGSNATRPHTGSNAARPHAGSNAARPHAGSNASRPHGGSNAAAPPPASSSADAAAAMQGPSMTEDEFMLQMAVVLRPAPTFVSPYGTAPKPLPAVIPFSTLRRGERPCAAARRLITPRSPPTVATPVAIRLLSTFY